MPSLNKVFGTLPVTIFEAMSQLARDNNAINLGQGFPDDLGPEDIRRAAAEATVNGYNQYPSMMGIPELRQAIATHYGHWHGLKLDPMTEVMVTSGGTEALTSAILAERKDLARSRDRLTAGLESIGFPVLRSQGTYFLTVDLSPLGLNETDEAFCRRIVTEYKVAAIPVSAFYEQDAVTSVVRFCFAKKDSTLDTALERLSDAVHRRKKVGV